MRTQGMPEARVLEAGIPYLIFVGTYWVVGGLFLLLELSPAARDAWKGIKCQPARTMPWDSIRNITRNVGLQQLTVYPLALWLLGPVVRQRCSFAPELPGVKETLFGLVVCAICAEVYFFHVHWALHHPKLYPHVHKVHHEFTAPIALECIYFHPIESVLNFGVISSGPLLLGSHVTLLYLFTAIGVFNVLVHHCGYEVLRPVTVRYHRLQITHHISPPAAPPPPPSAPTSRGPTSHLSPSHMLASARSLSTPRQSSAA